MRCLRCHAALLSPSLGPLPFLTYPLAIPPSLALILVFLSALCRGSAPTRGALMKSFQGGKWRSEMSFSDQMSLKQGPGAPFAALNFISSLFGFFTSAFTNTIARRNHLWLSGIFSHLRSDKGNYPVHWEESWIIPYLDTVICVSLSIISCSKITLVQSGISQLLNGVVQSWFPEDESSTFVVPSWFLYLIRFSWNCFLITFDYILSFNLVPSSGHFLWIFSFSFCIVPVIDFI